MGLTWNITKVDIEWLRVEREYKGTANAEEYIVDCMSLNLNGKDQKRIELKNIS